MVLLCPATHLAVTGLDGYTTNISGELLWIRNHLQGSMDVHLIFPGFMGGYDNPTLVGSVFDLCYWLKIVHNCVKFLMLLRQHCSAMMWELFGLLTPPLPPG